MAGYKVISPLVIVPNDDGVSGDGYFYKDSVIADGFNDKRCKVLVKDGMLEVVKAEPAKSDKVEDVLSEVGDDKDKAATALAAEKSGKNRPTLVGPLEAILGKA